MPKSTEPAHYLPVPLKSKSASLLLRIASSPTSFPITLVATDGSVPFSAKRFLSRPFIPILTVVSKKDVQAGKSGSFDGTDEEWQKIVMDALFSTSAQDITLSASLNKAKDKITIRLGTLEILEDEDAEVDLMEWLTESAQATIAAKTESRKLKETTSSEQDMIEKLQAQLDELVKAKEDHETLLITKFNMLLNSKKAKIRELTNNGPVPEARIPQQVSDKEDQEEEPAPKKSRGKSAASTSKTKATTSKGRAASARKTTSPPAKRTTAAAKGKRKRTPTPEPEEDEMDEIEEGNNGDEGGGDETEDEGSVQGDEERDADVERTFGVRDDEGDVTEDEEL